MGARGTSSTSRWRLRQRLAIGALLLCAVAGAGAGLKIRSDVRTAERHLAGLQVQVSPVVLDRNDLLLRAFLSPDDKWRLPVGPADVDPLYWRMLIAFEDRRFYSHSGVDPRAFVRAAVQAALNGRIVSGGSTLTMQVARLLDESGTRSLTAKYDQIVSALALERLYTKEEILALYALRAPFGGNLEGVRAASLTWFGKEPDRLTPAQAALLVALPQSPEGRRPDRFGDAARLARNRILDRAVGAGVLSAADAIAAKSERMPKRWRAMPRLAPHRAQAAILAAPQKAVHRLTIDKALQSRLESMLARRAAAFAPHVSAAILVADHQTGEVRAALGSPDLLNEARDGHVDMTLATRSPGSTLKPFIYGLAFEDRIAHPNSLVSDRPVDVSGYKPTNFDLSYQGTVTIREALQLSLNTPSVRMLEAIGPSKLFARLKRAGLRPRLPEGKTPGLAVALGGVGVSLQDLVAAFGALARLGRPLFLSIDAEQSTALAVTGSRGRPVLSAEAAWFVGDILSGLPQPQAADTSAVAYKTGTSYGYRDAWAVGYDGRHVAGVWLGRADGTPVPRQTGADAAAPILFEVFQNLGAERVPLAPPPATLTAEARSTPPEALREARIGLESKTGNVLGITYPPDGAVVDLGLSSGSKSDLVIKMTGGRLPFFVLFDGRPVPQGGGLYSRTLSRPLPAGGFVEVTVIDSRGDSASVQLFAK